MNVGIRSVCSDLNYDSEVVGSLSALVVFIRLNSPTQRDRRPILLHRAAFLYLIFHSLNLMDFSITCKFLKLANLITMLDFDDFKTTGKVFVAECLTFLDPVLRPFM